MTKTAIEWPSEGGLTVRDLEPGTWFSYQAGKDVVLLCLLPENDVASLDERRGVPVLVFSEAGRWRLRLFLPTIPVLEVYDSVGIALGRKR